MTGRRMQLVGRAVSRTVPRLIVTLVVVALYAGALVEILVPGSRLADVRLWAGIIGMLYAALCLAPWVAGEENEARSPAGGEGKRE